METNELPINDNAPSQAASPEALWASLPQRIAESRERFLRALGGYPRPGDGSFPMIEHLGHLQELAEVLKTRQELWQSIPSFHHASLGLNPLNEGEPDYRRYISVSPEARNVYRVCAVNVPPSTTSIIGASTVIGDYDLEETPNVLAEQLIRLQRFPAP